MRILIYTVGSTQCEATLRFGAEFAKALSAETTLLGIVAKRQMDAALGPVLDRTARDLADCGLPVQVRIAADHAEKVVAAELGRCAYDLVAVGALGGQRTRHSLVDLVAMPVVDWSVGSVLVVKGTRSQLSRILICTSGTKYSRPAVQSGTAVARAAGAQVTLLHVTELMPIMYTGLKRMEETLTEFLQSDTEQTRELKWAVQVLKAECGATEVRLRRGIVADEILHEGCDGDYDLIVLGSSRVANGLVRVLMGDLTRAILSRTQRPVLVVCPPNQMATRLLVMSDTLGTDLKGDREGSDDHKGDSQGTRSGTRYCRVAFYRVGRARQPSRGVLDDWYTLSTPSHVSEPTPTGKRSSNWKLAGAIAFAT